MVIGTAEWVFSRTTNGGGSSSLSMTAAASGDDPLREPWTATAAAADGTETGVRIPWCTRLRSAARRSRAYSRDTATSRAAYGSAAAASARTTGPRVLHVSSIRDR